MLLDALVIGQFVFTHTMSITFTSCQRYQNQLIVIQANFSVTSTLEMSEVCLRRELTVDRMWMFSVLIVQN